MSWRGSVQRAGVFDVIGQKFLHQPFGVFIAMYERMLHKCLYGFAAGMFTGGFHGQRLIRLHMLYEASDRAGERPVAQRLHTVLVYKAVGLYDAFSGSVIAPRLG